MRRALLRHLLLTAIAAVLVSGLVMLGVWRYARDDARRDTERMAHQIAATVLYPGRIDTADLMERLRPLLASGMVQRVKVFEVTGGVATIVASDEPRVIGMSGRVDGARGALQPGQVLVQPEPHNEAHRYEEALAGERMEAFVAFRDTSGDDMRLELYLPVDVAGTTRTAVGELLPVVLAGLLILGAATVPLSIMLGRRFADARAAQEYGLAAAERTRRDLARRLHDGVIPELAGAGLLLETGSPELVSRAHGLIAGEVRSLRNLLTELLPDEPISEPALRRLVAEIAAGAPEPAPRLELDVGTVDPAASLLLHRIAGELLRNAFQHATAETVTVRAHDAQLTVTDDGAGFDPQAAREPGHVGLRLVERAVHEAGGRFVVESAPGAGTTVTADLAGIRRADRPAGRAPGA
ncbi:MAG: ATP-binding protein [Actinoplanes sp.]